jgi:hypothetical protein
LSARTASAGTTRQRRTRRSIPVAWSTRSSAAGAASTRRTRKPARRLLVRGEVPTLRRSHRRYPLRGAVGIIPGEYPVRLMVLGRACRRRHGSGGASSRAGIT